MTYYIQRPNVNTPDNPDEEIIIDDAEAGFVKGRDPADYLSVLRVSADSEEAYRDQKYFLVLRFVTLRR